jgi:hypothetical protein
VDGDNIGHCRKCGKVRDFREGAMLALKKLYHPVREEFHFGE